jgi:asparagine N-glycosylation enzyme membrane subunit Stt3
MALGGDLWFETFAVPWLADEVPNAFDESPTVLLGLGALASYWLFAIGWVVYGVATLRAHAPVVIAGAIAVGGLLGFQALLSPWAVPLGLAVAALGIWLTRTQTATTDARATGTPRPEQVGR